MIFRDFEQKIIKNINESGMSIDAIYFIMKSIMQEIEQRYFEYCRQEDVERAEMVEKELESDKENKKLTSANDNEKGAN